MKKRTLSGMVRFVTGSGIVAASLFTLALPAQADRGQVVRLNAAGYDICRQLEASGGPVWSGKVRGKLLDGGAYGSGYKFNITNCFRTQRECTQFVGSIENRITQVDMINARICRKRF
ncbi:MAG: hypothetical protein JJ891_15160 [Rhizobiaceae bacterium]|nr:hypothetical protein [Rhizobiaceae bacterium]